MTHIIRERKIFSPFTHHGMAVLQFRPSRARRAALLPLAAELIPLGGRITRRWLGRYTSAYYAAVVDRVLEPLLRGADVVHILGSNLLAVAAVRSAHRLGAPVAISPFAHVGEWGDDVASVSAYRDADILLATTGADGDAYRSLGVPSEQIEIVGLPVPDALEGLAGPTAAPPPEQIPPPEAPVILFLGQRRPTKRYELLLAAAERVWRASPRRLFRVRRPGKSPTRRRFPHPRRRPRLGRDSRLVAATRRGAVAAIGQRVVRDGRGGGVEPEPAGAGQRHPGAK